jgi:hypothetical protein
MSNTKTLSLTEEEAKKLYADVNVPAFFKETLEAVKSEDFPFETIIKKEYRSFQLT